MDCGWHSDCILFVLLWNLGRKNDRARLGPGGILEVKYDAVLVSVLLDLRAEIYALSSLAHGCDTRVLLLLLRARGFRFNSTRARCAAQDQFYPLTASLLRVGSALRAEWGFR